MKRAVLILVFILAPALIWGFGAQSALGGVDAGCRDTHWDLPIGSSEDPNILQNIETTKKYGEGLRGVLFKSETGSAIRAPAAGVLTDTGGNASGPFVTLSVGDVKNVFQPAKTDRKIGEKVAQSEEFAIQVTKNDGTSRCEEGPCLYWSVKRADESYYKPLNFVFRPRIVLRE